MSDWRHRARCLNEDSETFFPIGNTGPALEQTEEAKAVCRRCDVVEECLRFALDGGESGVWGNTSEDERRALKRRSAVRRTTGYVDATPSVNAVRYLNAAGWSMRQMHSATGISIARLSGLSRGLQKSIDPADEAKLVALLRQPVPSRDPETSAVPA